MALEEIEAPMSDVLGTSFSEGWLYSPVSSLARLRELRQAEGALARDEDAHRSRSPADRRMLPRGPTADELEERGELTPYVGKEDAKERAKAAGVELEIPEEGVRDAALEILIERKKEENARRSTLARAPEGVTSTVLQFGAGLTASMLDPINVASAFVPVVSTARYGQMLSKARGAAGRAGVRVRAGAIEGAAGATAVEPLVYGAAQAEQADYGMTDSLLNIAFGTVLGGGLHTGAGAIGDSVRKGRPWWEAEPRGETAERVQSFSHEQRVAAGRSAVAQAVSGRRINVGPAMRFFEEQNRVRPPTIEAARRATIEAESDRMRAQVETDASQRMTTEELDGMRRQREEIQTQIETLDSQLPERTREVQREQKIGAARAEPVARRQIETEREQLTQRRQRLDDEITRGERAATAEADRAALERGDVPERFREEIETEAGRRYEQTGARAARDPETDQAIAARVPESMDAAWRDLKRTARAENESPSPLADDAVAEEIRTRLAEALDETDQAAVQQSVTEIEQDLQEVAARIGDDVTEFVAETARLTDEAATFREGFQTYAACRMRNG